jgi:HEAT repeat protein
MSRTHVVGAITLLVCVVTAPHVGARWLLQSSPTSGAPPISDKRAVLNDLAAHRTSLPPQELVAVLRSGITDSDPMVRASALWAVAGRAGGVRFSTGSERAERRAILRTERGVLEGLRPIILRRLQDDHDVEVRRAALAAAGNLDYDPDGGNDRSITLKPDFAKLLTAIFAKETSQDLRVEIVKSFALLSPKQAASIRNDSEAMLVAAALDPNPDVAAYGALGIGKQRLRSALPRIVGLLTRDGMNVRLFAAQAIGMFGREAAQYAPQVEAALAVERDVVVSKTLTATLSAIRSR